MEVKVPQWIKNRGVAIKALFVQNPLDTATVVIISLLVGHYIL